MTIELRSRLQRTAPITSTGDTVIERRARAASNWSVRHSITPDHVVGAARDQEAAGYDGVLVAERSGWPDVYASSMWALAHTTTISTVSAHRIGRQSPTTVARLAQTMDMLSSGRLIHHFITGHNEQDQQRDGDFADKPARYRRAAEFFEVYLQELTATEEFDFDGEFYKVRGGLSGVGNFSTPYSEISWAGSSDAAIDVAARYADTFSLPAEPLATTLELVEKVNAVATGYGRTLKYWHNANHIIAASDAEARAIAEGAVKFIEDNPSLLKLDITTPESVSRKRIAEMANVSDWSDDSLFLGLSRLTGVESVPAFVGSPETVAASMLRYYAAGVDVFGMDPTSYSQEEFEAKAELIRLLRIGGAEIDAQRAAEAAL